jgi:CubicO group peptidase (beta-lactamase class C family)
MHSMEVRRRTLLKTFSRRSPTRSTVNFESDDMSKPRTPPAWSRRSILRLATAPFALSLTRGIAFAADSNSILPVKELDSLIQGARETIRTTMDEAGIPGAAVALIYRGTPVWIETFGVTDGHTGSCIDEHTIFSIQSTSKHVTATAIMMAVERSLLDLDRPILDYLPEFSVKSRHEKNPQNRMTLRLLLSHRAGLTHEAPIGNNYYPTTPSFEAHVHSISQTWLRYPVGERFSYSNLGFDLAGYILEKVTGVPFAEWLQTNIYKPIGMVATTSAEEIYLARENRALGHHPGYDTVPARIPLIPSGGVYSSISDMARYATLHLGRGTVQGKTILSRSRWEEMHSLAYTGEYGLGVRQHEQLFETGFVRTFHHFGGGFGFRARFSYSPQVGLGWVALFNGVTVESAIPRRDLLVFGMERMLQAKYGQPLPDVLPAIKAIDMPVDALRRFVGNYLAPGYSIDMILTGDSLAFEHGGGLNRLKFSSPVEAWVNQGPMAGTLLRYHREEGSKAAHFQLPDGEHLDYNDGPYDLPGEILTQYDDRLGRYMLFMWGKPEIRVLSKKNGYLYLDRFRLTEHQRRIFFTAAGEVVDLRTCDAIYRSLRLHKETECTLN